MYLLDVLVALGQGHFHGGGLIDLDEMAIKAIYSHYMPLYIAAYTLQSCTT